MVQLGALDVARLAPLFREQLDRSVRLCEGRASTDELLDLAALRKVQVWLVLGSPNEILAVLVTEVHEYTSKRVCRLIQGAGEGLHRWKHLVDVIEKWAASAGCTAIEMHGRRGWGKVYPDYAPLYTVFAKEIRP